MNRVDTLFTYLLAAFLMSHGPKCILIVEDEKPIARVLSLKLRNEGFDITLAEDGFAGLEMLKDGKFDLIILDLMMPKLDGFSVLAELKEQGNTIPVIVASNLSQEEDVKKAKAFGAKEFFVKSEVSLNDLVEKIKQCI